jgi:hypothetical protein
LNAGFDEVHVRTETRPLRLPAGRDFLWHAYAPLAGAIGELNVDGRAALGVTPCRLGAMGADGGLTYEQPILTASART